MSAMANMSRRDRMIAAVGGIVVLYALAFVVWFMSQERAWRVASRKYAAAVKKTVSEKKLIAERGKWYDAYESEREKMPVFSTDSKDVDTHWLSRMDSIAQTCNVGISQRQAGQQVVAGDVFEQPIDVKRWEATITSLVKFMHSLEAEKEAMFDIREISVKPSSHKGFLTGNFKLACAYMRGEVEE
jgi:hypothetical protein